jgi:Predicted metal-dependent phosphoesterases (PHP family)
MKHYIDLHVHSKASDGIFTPSELVDLAQTAGLYAIALSDHDSVDGIDEAVSAAANSGLRIIPAVELSVEYGKHHDVHLLGYWINHKDIVFCRMLEQFREKRESRGLKVIEKINLKLEHEGREPIDNAEVIALASGSLGRPHIARVLIDKGYAATMQDAFNNYLQPCNVPKEYLPFEEAVKEIKRIGGVPVLAHPQSLTRNREELKGIIADMAGKGLEGIEAYNTMGVEGDDTALRRLADSLGLASTGGSDFHGGEDGLQLGKGRGNLAVTSELLESLEAKRKQGTAKTG